MFINISASGELSRYCLRT